MLNPFPELLNYALLGPFILRLVLGVIFIDLGVLKFRSEKNRWLETFKTLHLNPADLLLPFYALLQIIGGGMLLIGFYTQIASLLFVLFSGAELYIEWRAKEILKRDIVFYVLIFTISLSLLLSGAGAYALDLPL
jgi:uncharacterized membrane protein YphA (DoxX/SURF4 family)